MILSIRKMSELASAMEISKYPNSPLIKSADDKIVLVAFDGRKEYILGYVTKSDVSTTELVYSQFFSGSYGHSLNDLYNNVQDPDDVGSTQSKKNRTVLVGNSTFISSVFHDGTNSRYGFKDGAFWKESDYTGIESSPEAPVSPILTDESNFLSLNNGNKIYQSSSGSLEEHNAMRINIGIGDTDIHSYGDWTPNTLRSETPVERLERSISEGTYASGSRVGFPDPSTFHVFNFVDNTSFFMGNNIIEIEKANSDNSVYAKTVYDADGVLIEVDTAGVVVLKVGTTTLTVNDGTVNIEGDMTFTGNLIVTGSLDVGGGKVIVNSAGKLITTGGNELA